MQLRHIRNISLPHVGLGPSQGTDRRKNGPMERSTRRILTTHTGSLPRVASIVEVLRQRERGESADPAEMERAALTATREVVDQQLQVGLDIVNDGEQHKPSYATYVIDRVAGFDGERRAVFPKRL